MTKAKVLGTNWLKSRSLFDVAFSCSICIHYDIWMQTDAMLSCSAVGENICLPRENSFIVKAFNRLD